MLDLLPVSSTLATPLEIITALSVFCICFLLCNITRFEHAFRCLIALLLTSFALTHSIMAVECSPDPAGEIFATMSICGAIAQFSFAGALFISLVGGLPGFVITLALGFICCPIVWLRIVFNILLVILRYPKAAIWPAAILAVSIGVGSYTPSTVLDDGESPSQTISRGTQPEDNGASSINQLINRYPDLSQVRERNSLTQAPVCYAVSIACNKTGTRSVLAVNHSYNTRTLVSCCLDDELQQLDILNCSADVTNLDTPVLRLIPAANGHGCMVQSMNGAKVLVNGGKECTEPVELKPGMTLWIPLTRDTNMNHILRVISVEYLDDKGRSCSQEANLLNQLLSRH